MTMLTYAILPKGEGYVVAHMGLAKVCGQEGYQTVWVVDNDVGTMLLAIEAMNVLVEAQRVRLIHEEADRKALVRRR